jgi:quinone-modifying oxidoreductase subunit QmoB
MEKKIGVYICGGCGIGEAVDVEKLADTARSEFKAPVFIHPFLCGAEAAGQIRADIADGKINAPVIAACSPRAKSEVFAFDPRMTVLDRVNLREQVAWSHEPSLAEGETFDEDIRMLAEDQLRMGVARARNIDPPEPYMAEFTKRILVVGGGTTGMTSAIEAARAGYEVVLVEKAPVLGGFAAKLFKEYPKVPPYREPGPPDYGLLIDAIAKEPGVKVLASAAVEKIDGAPGMFDASIRQNGNVLCERVGAIVLATGFVPYDAANLGHLGFGASPNVVTTAAMEEMAAGGKLVRPSDGKAAKSVAFILCAGSRDAKHLPYCSTTCCLTSLKQALYVREADPEARVFIFYKDIRAPGQYENFYRRVQEDEGVFLTKGQATAVDPQPDGTVLVEVDDTLLGEKISIAADVVVLATGMVPRTALGEEEALIACQEDDKQKGDRPQDMASRLLIPTKMIKSDTLNLGYRQGPELPDLKYGFPDSHYICFPYETRRTGIYAAGPVRQPMDMAFSKEDGRGAALKAIQCVELTSAGKSLHPRVGDMSYPELFMQRCTRCKRCTEECPFGMYNEDEKSNPLPNPTRCRRCSICMGSCPERIISFKDYSVPMIGAMIKAIEVPEEDEEKPRILILACENDAYPALDMIGERRGRYNPYVRIIPLRCLGSLNLVWVADSLSKGIDGILLLGCVHGDDYQCHMIKGSELANYRLSKIQETLNRLALESKRLRIEEIQISDYDRLPGIIDEFLETINDVGPNPYKGF